VDELVALDRAERTWRSALKSARDADMAAPSSCGDWSIGDLIGHVNGGGHRYLLLVSGAPATEVEATRGQNYLAPDPVSCFSMYEDPLHEVFSDRSRWDDPVTHRAGPRSVRTLMLMRELELTLHSWDLLDSIGTLSHIDDDLAAYLLVEAISTVDELRVLGFYGAALESMAEGSGKTLLAATGRDSGLGDSTQV
jgi:uncharacterized protein (TIGR03086 family)